MYKPHFCKIRGLLRPLLLLLTLCLCVSSITFYRAADPPADTQVMFILFHDQNASGRWEAGEPVPQTSMSLGYSGIDVSYGGTTSTQLTEIGGYWFNYVSLYLPGGTYRLYPQSVPSGYKIGGRYLTTYQSGHADSYSTDTFIVRQGDVTSVYIPLLRANSKEASATGRVVYTDDTNTGVAGCRVDLLDESGATFIAHTTTDQNGVYQFKELELGYYRVQVTPPAGTDNTRYQLDIPRSSPFMVLDGVQAAGPDFQVTRVTSVQFWMGSTLVGQLVNAPYGQTIIQPEIASPHLNLSNGYRTITGWYLDESLTLPWSFETSTVSGPTNLYASYKTTYYRSGSGSSSSGGSSRRDADRPPTIKSASATINGDQVTLSVEMDGIFDVFDYLWQMKDASGTWVELPDARAAVVTLGGVEPGATYTFRATVWRTYDGQEVQSGEIVVKAPGGVAEELPPDALEPEDSYIPPSASWDGTGAAFSVSSDILFVNGRMEATAASAGGQWFWESSYFEAENQNTANPVFTAVKSGTTTVAYSHNGQTTTVTVLIHPASLPATGQSLTPVFILGSAGLLTLFAALILYLRERRSPCGKQ